MNKSDLFPALQDITFAEKDPDTITQEVISRYELIAGRTLTRSDPVRLFLESVILYFIQQRNVIDFSAKMNLLAYSSGQYLDHLGALFGVSRLAASSASCTVKFSLPKTLNYPVTIPEGTRLTPNGEIFFATSADCVIPAGTLTGITTLIAETPGSDSNDFVAGQIYKFVDILPFPVTAENIDTTSGGTDQEDDEALRERIMLAPESYSNAGSIKGYEYFARTADPNIASVAVIGPPDTNPGHVNIYPLMKGGALPGQDTINAVLNICSSDSVRPDTDYVHVLSPEVISFSVEVAYWVDVKNSASLEAIKAGVNLAVHSWVSWQKSLLGRDINPSQLSHDIIAAGAKRCEIISPSFTPLKAWQVASADNLIVNYSGLES